ncbi:FAD-dependent oxidoreductase [Streptomyces cyaneofuscatus]|uniref:FAD-dependent oxidoreductase n=1 Tax=Streptomyces cyaneofuscatus TaxID=66883 RepID=UPI0036B9F69E
MGSGQAGPPCSARPGGTVRALLLGWQARTVARGPHGRLTVTADRGAPAEAGAVLVTGDVGRFVPRWLPRRTSLAVVWSSSWPEPQAPGGRDVVVVGGGDQRRGLGAGAGTPPGQYHTHAPARRVPDSSGQCARGRRGGSRHTGPTRRRPSVIGDRAVEAVRLVGRATSKPKLVPCDSLIAALGFTAQLGPLEPWGLDIVERRLVVDSRMATSITGIFAAGDITEYPGKVR